MTFVQVRDAIVDGLEKHIRRPVKLSDQITETPEYPYCYYSILSPRMSSHAFGLNEVQIRHRRPVFIRSEPVEASLSFTFCSKNRTVKGGKPIFGDDEALELAEKAHGFFLLTGHNISTEHGDVVVRSVGNVAPRNGFVVEDTVRRYGFDVRVGYVRTDETPTEIIEHPGNPHGYINQ